MTALDEVRDDLERDPRQALPPGGRDPFAVDEDAALDVLHAQLGDYYHCGVDGRGQWWALRRDGRPGVSADGPDELLAAAYADYAALPVVPR